MDSKKEGEAMYAGGDANMHEVPNNSMALGQESQDDNKNATTEETQTIIEKLVQKVISLENMIESTKNILKYEREKIDRMMQVYAEMMKIEGLTDHQRLHVGSLINKDIITMSYFLSVDDEFKVAYVQQVLAAYISGSSL
ncbi:hypothetical protein RJT34_15606 [Clitoria ternatea]|uniref:Uncharacterized protein n=1 Tax=Clitoria ternatea TaxID=43366 RepID=A0AAN9J7M7_CLITE